ncbi:hypothetical protein Tco_0058519 [Tanacetum coccineum]
MIPPKKRRGKGSQVKKSVVTPKPASVEVSDESDPEPAKRQTRSRRKSKKKVSIYVDENIIHKPDVALELGKYISLVEAEEEEAARRVHATHERRVSESDEPSGDPANRPTGRRRPSRIAFRYTSSVLAKSPAGVTHILDAQVKELVLHQGVPDESIVILTTLSEGTEEESEYSEEAIVEEEIEYLTTDEEEEKKDDDEDDRSIDIEKTDDDEEIDDEFVHG